MVYVSPSSFVLPFCKKKEGETHSRQFFFLSRIDFGERGCRIGSIVLVLSGVTDSLRISILVVRNKKLPSMF
jgi:hypothetical protein